MNLLLDRLSPDLGSTLRRFPFAIVLAAAATAIFVGLVNDYFGNDYEPWLRLFAGLATGAIFATAGSFFSESRSESGALGLILTYAMPALAVLLFQWDLLNWFVPFTLPIIATLWLSVSAFTGDWRGEAGEQAENRFWWLNHRAAVSAIIAAVAFLVIAIGIFAIEQSLALLFGLELETLFYRYILPVAGLFLAPVYWLSTLPKLADFSPGDLSEPDFLSRAIGFLGQFLLAPLLGAYALILLAYAVQILFTFTLPQGVLGWMVLAFTVTGAATWLVLHPPFMRERQIVRFLRRGWFWATIIPLALYAVAVGIRIDAYGLTPERMALIAGGVWAAALTIVFLVPRWGDIRLIPVVAGLTLLAFSIGPWNFVYAPVWSQATRLDDAISGAFAEGETPQWTTENAAKAKGAAEYLLSAEDEGQAALRGVLLRYGAEDNPRLGWPWIAEALRIPTDTDANLPFSVRLTYESGEPVAVNATPYVFGSVLIWQNAPTVSFGWGFELTAEETLEVSRGGDLLAAIPLGAWIDAQQPPEITAPALDFAVDGRAFRIVVTQADLRGAGGAGGDRRQLTHMAGTLFSASAD